MNYSMNKWVGRFAAFAFLLFFCLHGYAQPVKIISGPMIGNVDMREATIWVQTDGPNALELNCWKTTDPATVTKKVGSTLETSGYTVTFTLDGLEPATEYTYTVNVPFAQGPEPVKHTFRTQPLWQYRTDPPAFQVAIGSCAFINETEYDRPGEAYGGSCSIFESIAARKPDLMLWLGDNVYFREVDWNTRSGMIYRYTHMRSIPEMQPLLQCCAHYAIWDDHDFGPNDSNGSFVHKDWSRDVFQLFWPNPGCGLPPDHEGITTQFTWGDVDFFLLDNRWFRTESDIVGIEPTVLGEMQILWLIQALKYSKAPFKMVAIGGQFLNPVAKFENYSRWSAERERILKLIEENNISGVIFLSGDRHCTELSHLTLGNGKEVYDLTVSPLTSHSYDNTQEANTLRTEGTLVPEQNFAMLSFSGELGKRIMTITDYAVDGKEKWTRVIPQQ